MRLVYPPESHQTHESSTFFIGSTEPGASLTLNNAQVPVSPKGYFAWKVPLNSGENTFKLIAQMGAGSPETETRKILRSEVPELTEVPENADVIRNLVYPAEDLGLQPGETVTLFCPAPKGSKVMCRIEWLMSRAIEMNPLDLPMDNRSGVFGQLHQTDQPFPDCDFFLAQIHVPINTPPLPNLVIQFIIQKDEKRLEFRSPGSVTILPLGKRPAARIQTTEAVVRGFPRKGARKTPLPKETLIEICGFWGEAYRARYGPDVVAWVMREDIQLLEGALYPPQVPIHLIQTDVGPRSFQVIIPMSRLVPLDITLDARKVRLRLIGVQSHCDFIHYQKDVLEQGLRQITWRQVNSEVMEVEISLDSPLFGFQRYYDPATKALVCSIRTARSIESFPFVVAIDPGHGGEESGAMAPNGIAEKSLNLVMALKLQHLLTQIPDLKVVLTRSQDETLTLEERVQKAVAAEANLLISLHHNALPDGRNPLEEQGVSTFYYHPYALPLARKFQQYMVKETGFADYGLLYDSLHLCRVMEMPALLLELGFLTHPEDAERCLDDQQQNRMARAIGLAIKSCMKAPTV
jgi:N-acetylmuramoyl-L-alanine amidase